VIIGIPKEVKQGEGRVAATPDLVLELVSSGNSILIEYGAGDASGFSDTSYEEAGAQLVLRDEVWSRSDLVLKVKEPIEAEYHYFRPGLTVFCFLHLAAAPELCAKLVEQQVTGLAFETLAADGRLPILEPMSAIAGRLSGLWGAFLLQRTQGGKGILMGGLPGLHGAKVLVLGGGTVGYHAADVAQGLRAEVTISEPSPERVLALRGMLRDPFAVLDGSPADVARAAIDADVIIGAVLVPGASAPMLISEQTVARMQAGSVICDVAIDQGGCIETSRPTTHSDPIFVQHGVVHQCITNLPAAAARDATQALVSALWPYVTSLASEGIDAAIDRDPVFATAVNVRAGKIVHPALLETSSRRTNSLTRSASDD
jgi:alanine dehydrogenase